MRYIHISVKHLIIAFLFLSFTKINAQEPTIGLQYNSSYVSDGYTLFTPQLSNNVYLVDNCGGKVNQWTFSEKPGATCYLLENGNLLRAGKDSLQIRDWNNNIVWSYAMTDNGLAQHHDIEPMPNGNILCLLKDVFSGEDIVVAGRDSLLVDDQFKLDKIVELHPIGVSDASVVWEWRFIDRFIQDKDTTKPNFGSINENPKRLDINYDNSYTSDWTHVNAIDYNADLDQILITARHLSEVYIIDHSTSTKEAAGHTGGNFNSGGDFLWRWGNSQVYNKGSHDVQKLFLPHDAKWVEPGYNDYGKITVFNNGGDGTNNYSSVHLIYPVIMNEGYQLENNKYVPEDFEWSWHGSILGTTVHESKKSGTHALPNGNFIICETTYGRVSEISRNGMLLWAYANPVSSIVHTQYDTIPNDNNAIFRGEKYPEFFPGFEGMNMSADGTIENENPLSDACITTSVPVISENRTSIVNPVCNNEIKFISEIKVDAVSVIDISGKTLLKITDFHSQSIKVNLKNGFYILQLQKNSNVETIKFIVR